ncbi:MAG TPA: helix-turn-helix domain-containing protein [Candidatus Paceibacterota bacterium]|nr:helix-turn-helix domain-containing protein [Candidatus Paceibacterota bacterium]
MKPTHTTCPVTKTARMLSDTWTMLIAHALLGGPLHFCELERELPGISTRTLTLKLKKLEDERIVKKLRSGAYAATRKGEGLKMVESAMRRYGEKFL